MTLIEVFELQGSKFPFKAVLCSQDYPKLNGTYTFIRKHTSEVAGFWFDEGPVDAGWWHADNPSFELPSKPKTGEWNTTYNNIQTVPRECLCKISTLMGEGCQCGSISKYEVKW